MLALRRVNVHQYIFGDEAARARGLNVDIDAIRLFVHRQCNVVCGVLLAIPRLRASRCHEIVQNAEMRGRARD